MGQLPPVPDWSFLDDLADTGDRGCIVRVDIYGLIFFNQRYALTRADRLLIGLHDLLQTAAGEGKVYPAGADDFFIIARNPHKCQLAGVTAAVQQQASVVFARALEGALEPDQTPWDIREALEAGAKDRLPIEQVLLGHACGQLDRELLLAADQDLARVRRDFAASLPWPCGHRH